MNHLLNENGHIEVTSLGSLLTVQDTGRRGSQRFGVSVSGVLDLQAATIANRLVGNPPDSAMLEATFGNVALTFDKETKIAITGATSDLYIDDFPMPLWETLIIPAGATLSISAPSSGLYSYVAIAGGIDVPKVLGSRSTHIGSSLGGFEGRALSQRDVLLIGTASATPIRPRAGTTAPQDLLRACDDNERRVRVIPGPQHDAFDDEAQSTFFSSTFTISNVTNRQGARLEGPTVPAIDGKHDIVSDPAYMGAVQVPSDGNPIVLLADRQPTGGYAKIASVISADLPTVVQRPPGSEIAFELTDLNMAQQEAKEFVDRIHHEPLVEPARIFSTNLEVNGETYNVELVRPSSVDSESDVEGIVYASFGQASESVATVESIN